MRSKRQVAAPTVIIAPEHQSAPRAPELSRAEIEAAEVKYQHHSSPDDFDRELDPEIPLTPRELREMAALARRDAAKSSEAMLEEALRQHEITLARHAPYRWAGQERWIGRESEEMRKVNFLHPHTVIARLQRAGVRCEVNDPCDWFREHKIPVELWPKPSARLWLNSFVRAGRVGVTVWQPGVGPETVTTLQYPWGPEWSLMRFNEQGVPTNERYRGWRTALLALVGAGVLTEKEVERAFPLTLGAPAGLYCQLLQGYRRMALGLEAKDGVAC